MRYLVEAATEAAGPAYRNVMAKDGLLQPPPGINSCWDIFRTSVEKYPNNPMLGRRKVVDGKAGEYAWMTYKEVYDAVMKLAASISRSGVNQGARCGIYGANCPEWIISMEACNALGVCCVPLYDTPGISLLLGRSWFDDLAVLGQHMYKRVMAAMAARDDVRAEARERCLVSYARGTILGLSRSMRRRLASAPVSSEALADP